MKYIIIKKRLRIGDYNYVQDSQPPDEESSPESKKLTPEATQVKQSGDREQENNVQVRRATLINKTNPKT